MNDVKASSLAKYIINKCEQDKHPISNLQLQKIMYYIQVAFLKKYKAPLFEERIEAWQFGPVVPEIYASYCGFGSLPICINYIDTLDIIEEDKEIINNIVEEKRKKQPWELVDDTHSPEKAWKMIYKDGQGNRKTMPIELMLQHG